MASSSIVNANASANTLESNALCVVVGMMTSYGNSNNMVNNLATEPYSNVGEKDLLDHEVLLETMKKQSIWWKPHQRTSPTWAFFKINDNKQVDLKQSQVVQSIVCHRQIASPEILALCTRCCKGLIAYNKCNGILAMTKHVEQDHVFFS
jgi:hypothetical protein